ncbi:hypothetical protein PanWU01x14_139020 [Parasponia andersonii]|uniref:Uncharacterized protein n=1 Tax=Parasponia andersonii TaxID=3476 RepID=A0A2P5CMU6_PARAD|nr:hypothetical protein PanWU01x14_139020 [Parasponia andersonii]
MDYPYSDSRPQTNPNHRLPPKRGQVLWMILKSFSKSEKPNENGGSPSPNTPSPAATPSGYASELSGPLN